jgi:hypothetical protein
VAQEVSQAWIDLDLARRNVELAKREVASAEEDQRLFHTRYLIGKSIALEDFDAAVKLFQARLAVTRSNLQLSNCRSEARAGQWSNLNVALLLEEGKYNEAVLSAWIEKLGERRGVTGLLAEPLESPTKAWGMEINNICDRYGLQLNVESCYERIGGMLDWHRERKKGAGNRMLCFQSRLEILSCVGSRFFR